MGLTPLEQLWSHPVLLTERQDGERETPGRGPILLGPMNVVTGLVLVQHEQWHPVPTLLWGVLVPPADTQHSLGCVCVSPASTTELRVLARSSPSPPPLLAPHPCGTPLGKRPPRHGRNGSRQGSGAIAGRSPHAGVQAQTMLGAGKQAGGQATHHGWQQAREEARQGEQWVHAGSTRRAAGPGLHAQVVGMVRLCRTGSPSPGAATQGVGMHHAMPRCSQCWDPHPGHRQSCMFPEVAGARRAMDLDTLRGNQTAPGHGCDSASSRAPGDCEGGG